MSGPSAVLNVVLTGTTDYTSLLMQATHWTCKHFVVLRLSLSVQICETGETDALTRCFLSFTRLTDRLRVNDSESLLHVKCVACMRKAE